MTKEQFEYLKQWLEERHNILSDMREYPQDTHRVEARRKELNLEDSIAEMYLVDEEK